MYKLFNNKTKEETLSDKVTIDGFDYYVSDKKPKENDWCIKEQQYLGKSLNRAISYSDLNSTTAIWKKIIATNNPNIDIPQILEEPNEDLIHQLAADLGYRMLPDDLEEGIKAGYKKHQETHSFSEEDMIEFGNWLQDIKSSIAYNDDTCSRLYKKSTKELFQVWKEQHPKIVYYE